MDTTAFFRKMPKIELHLHLEGAVLPGTLLSLARRNGIALPASTEEELRRWYTFSDFNHFLSVYLAISECIRSCDDIEFITREMLKEQARQNILYSEITYTPYTHLKQKGLSVAKQIEALERGKEWGKGNTGVSCNFICDISREVSEEEGLITVEGMLESGSDSVVALGLGGPESMFLPDRHKRAFDLAAEYGIPGVIHAGETAGPESIWCAVEKLKTVRVGHGVRAVEDPKLIEYLRKKGLVLEVCPSSNIRLGVFKSMEDHSLPQLIDAGIRVTVNSDDPPMFNTTLIHEYEILHDTFGYDPEVFFRCNQNAIDGALLTEEDRAALRRRFQQEWNAIS